MNTLRFYLILITALLLWSSAFVGIRIGLENGYSPGSLTLLRLSVASAFLWLMQHRVMNRISIPWKDALSMGMLGVIGVGLYHICLNYGEVTVSAGVASFIVGLMPVITVLLAWIFFSERMSGILWFGVIISFLGLLLIIIDESEGLQLDWGVFAILITAITGAILNLWQKPWLKKYHVVDVSAWVMWGGTASALIFLPSFLTEFSSASIKATAAGVYLGIFPAALANVAFAYILRHWSVTKASISLYSLPILSTIMGFLVLGEKISWMSFIGGLIALLGAVIANQKR